RKDPFDAQFFEAVDVRSKIQFRRRDRMVSMMPGKKDDLLAGERSDEIRVRRFSERGFHVDFFDLRQSLHLIKPASPDDSDPDITHVPLTPVVRRVLKRDVRKRFSYCPRL